MVFAFVGSFDVQPVVSPASGRGLASYSMRKLALQSEFRERVLDLRQIYLRINGLRINGLRPFPTSI